MKKFNSLITASKKTTGSELKASFETVEVKKREADITSGKYYQQASRRSAIPEYFPPKAQA